jgi:hypothetical protein
MIRQEPTAEKPRLSPFDESRIFAEGWKAARQSSEPPPNPYHREPERTRWREGFNQALA